MKAAMNVAMARMKPTTIRALDVGLGEEFTCAHSLLKDLGADEPAEAVRAEGQGDEGDTVRELIAFSHGLFLEGLDVLRGRHSARTLMATYV